MMGRSSQDALHTLLRAAQLLAAGGGPVSDSCTSRHFTARSLLESAASGKLVPTHFLAFGPSQVWQVTR